MTYLAAFDRYVCHLCRRLDGLVPQAAADRWAVRVGIVVGAVLSFLLIP